MLLHNEVYSPLTSFPWVSKIVAVKFDHIGRNPTAELNLVELFRGNNLTLWIFVETKFATVEII